MLTVWTEWRNSNSAYIIQRERKLNTLSKCKVKWTYIQIDKQSPSAELDGVRMQGGREYFPVNEQDPSAAQLFTTTKEGRKKHYHGKACHGTLFSKVWLLSIINIIPLL